MHTAPSSQPDTPPIDAPAWAQSLVAWWHRIECWTAVTAFGLITLLLIVDVVLRELVGPLLRVLHIYDGAIGILFAQRLSIYALIVGSFAGIGIATATGSHLVPRVGYGFVPTSWGPYMDRIADLVTGLVLVVVAYYGWVFVQSSRETDLRAPVLDWSVWRIQLAIPLGFLSAAGRYFVFAAFPALKPIPPEVQE